MIVALVLIPALAGLAAFALRPTLVRRALLLLTALAHAGLTAAAWVHRPMPALGGWLVLDAAGLVFLGITSLLFLAAAVYGLGYLAGESPKAMTDAEEGFLFTNAPEAVFIGCLLLFLAAMTLVTVCHHFGLLWVAIEATTLASAPLIYFHRHHRSLEATWKYLLICSVGIALALLGNFFLGVAAVQSKRAALPLELQALVASAPNLQAPWLKAAFILMLVGYGTKMGLTPLHTWLPDAHSEAPSVISALLSGALLNCAFLGIIRMQQVLTAAGLAPFGQQLLVLLGLASLAIAAVYILGQMDYKRLLAYSSVEHMGILALGVGIGGAGAYGSMLHAVNHSLTKAMLFFLAGILLAAYRTKTISQVRGVMRFSPLTGVLWLAGFFAITGTPPFGLFLSEFTILKAAFDQPMGVFLGLEVRYVVCGLYLLTLALIFIGMATAFLGMAQGEPGTTSAPPPRRPAWLLVLPPAVLGGLVLMLGFYLPPRLNALLEEAARLLARNG